MERIDKVFEGIRKLLVLTIGTFGLAIGLMAIIVYVIKEFLR